METTAVLDDRQFDDVVPQVRHDVIVRHYDNEAVAWSPVGLAPVQLDPLGALVLTLLDGEASIAELLTDINEVVGVPAVMARNQLRRVMAGLEQAALLTASSPQMTAAAEFDLFSGPPNP